jgi:dihydroflavonol-4-reductase
MVLVTGGTGLVGSHLLVKLAQQGEKIRATYRKGSDLEHVRTIFSYYSEASSDLFDTIEWQEANLNDIPKLTVAFENISHVYHCAAYISFDPSDYKKLRNTNIKGTANIVNLCIEHKIKKLCYVSSIATLGHHSDRIDEDTFWGGNQDQSVYAISKYGAEMEVWRGIQEGVSTVIVNPGVIIGPGFWNSGSGLLFKLAYKGNPYITEGITAYVDVNDVVVAMLQLMRSSIENQRYILAGANISYEEIMTMICKALHVKAPRKVASKFLLSVGWRADWLLSKIIGRKRKLTKQLAKTLIKKSIYSSDKILSDLKGFKFTPITDSVSARCREFLEDVGS